MSHYCCKTCGARYDACLCGKSDAEIIDGVMKRRLAAMRVRRQFTEEEIRDIVRQEIATVGKSESRDG